MENCPYLDGKPCYYDGSGLNAEPVFDILVKDSKAEVIFYNQMMGEWEVKTKEFAMD